jgi:hypothetical protein|tara:strand:- start:223 stop:444 length:222 start_codon:yes stop_codon:yes gene_type:complete
MKKSGWKTTEFWLASVATIVGILYASGAISPDGVSGLEKGIAFVAAALASFGYSHSRGAAKAAASTEDDKPQG